MLKDALEIGQKKFFAITKVKNTVPWTCVASDLNGEEIVGTSYGKRIEKNKLKKIRIEKVIKIKGDKLSFNWKSYSNSFNNWIDKKYIV